MAGQGSLCRAVFRVCRRRQAWRPFCASIWLSIAAIGILSPALAQSPETAEGEVDTIVQVSWSAEQARPWKVRIAVVEEDGEASSARISEVENHCSAGSATGQIDLSPDASQLRFASRESMPDGAVRFRVRGSVNSQLAIFFERPDVSDQDSAQASGASMVTMREVLAGRPVTGSRQSGTDSGELKWTVKRVNGDSLRIEFANASPLVKPLEDLSFAVRGNALTELASQSLFLRYELFRVGDGRVVTEKIQPINFDARGDTPPIGFAQQAPVEPGVYEVRCSIQRDEESIWSRLRRRDPPLAATGRPILVLSDGVEQATQAPVTWRTVGEIRPSEVAAWSVSQWLPASTNRLIPGSDPPHDLAEQTHANADVSVIRPGGGFQATLPVALPGYPHRVTLRYPAGRSMRLRIDIAGADSIDNPEQSFVLIEEESAQSKGDWATHTFVHYPTLKDQIRLTNLDDSTPAAFESISVQAGPDHLVPRSASHDRRRLAVLQMTGFDWVAALSRDTIRRGSVASCQADTIALYRLWIASDRLRDYVEACGMNSVSVPAVARGQAWFDCQSFQGQVVSPSLVENGLNVFLHLMDQCDLSVLLSVDASTALGAVRSPGQGSAATTPNAAERPPYRASLLGLAGEQAIGELVAEVDRLASPHKCYRGINLLVGDTVSRPDGQPAIVTEETLALFARSPAALESVSPAQLRQWVRQQGKAEFEKWQTNRRESVFDAIARRMVRGQFLVSSVSDQRGARPWIASPAKTDSKHVNVQGFCRVPVGSLSLRIRAQHSVSGLGATGNAVSAVCVWDASPSSLPAIPVVRNETFTDASRVIDRLDPEILMIRPTDWTGGLSSELTQLLTAFTGLPRQGIVPIESDDPAAAVVALRAGSDDDDHLMLVLSNRAPWRSEVSVNFSSVVRWAPSIKGVTAEGPRTTVVVPGGGVLVLRSESPMPDATIKSWSSRVAGGEPAVEAIKADVESIVARLGTLSELDTYPVLSNGGFEQQGGVGLVGWLHAQHPPDSVAVDSKESIEGDRSVRLSTDDRSTGRIWLVSETLPPPSSGRLAISLACRGERSGNDGTHRLRVSIEGTRDGQPIRQSTELKVPRDGKWQPRNVVLQVDGVGPDNVQSLRLTIDSLSAGRVWIDDVRLHDWFPLTKERGDLQSQAFLAVQGLQRGNLAPSARLFQNRWARHLLTAKVSPVTPAVIDKTEVSDEPPGVAERIRSWLPRPLRF